MSAFGDNYIKNDLNDNIQMFFKDGGTIEEMFDVLKYVFEYGEPHIDNLQKENEELKKQLEEKENIACNWKDSCLENAGKIEKLENQQKEFIKWLESMLDNDRDIFSVVRVKDVLSKYKEIIGVSNENRF